MKNLSYKLTLITMLLSTVVILFASFNTSAEAYCALRDPVSNIKKLFPTATNHKSIVRAIDESTRQKVGETFPELPLHFGELGRHTLYIAMRENKAIGMVHVRSEQSPWGLIEIAWAINMDLTIKDFAFQRCRNSQKKYLTTAEFKLQFMNKSFNEVRALYNQDTSGGTAEFLKKAGGADELANVVLKCGLKTLLVTQIAWQKDIAKLTSASLLKSLNIKEAVELNLINNIMDEKTQKRLLSVTGTKNIGIARDSVRAYQVLNSNSKTIALLYQGESKIDNNEVLLSWLLDTQGKIISVNTQSAWPSEQIKKLFMATQARSFNQIEQCGDRAELYALEVVTTLHPYLDENRL